MRPGTSLLAACGASQQGHAPLVAKPLGTSQLFGYKSTTTARPRARQHWVSPLRPPVERCTPRPWSGWHGLFAKPTQVGLSRVLHPQQTTHTSIQMRIVSLLGVIRQVCGYLVKWL